VGLAGGRHQAPPPHAGLSPLTAPQAAGRACTDPPTPIMTHPGQSPVWRLQGYGSTLPLFEGVTPIEGSQSTGVNRAADNVNPSLTRLQPLNAPPAPMERVILHDAEHPSGRTMQSLAPDFDDRSVRRSNPALGCTATDPDGPANVKQPRGSEAAPSISGGWLPSLSFASAPGEVPSETCCFMPKAAPAFLISRRMRHTSASPFRGSTPAYTAGGEPHFNASSARDPRRSGAV
jgi:hypothetical protein